MANYGYQYGTSPKKIKDDKNMIKKEPKLKIIKEEKRQKVSLSKKQKNKRIKSVFFAVLTFTILLTISYQNSQISIKFNELQNQKKQLSSLKKENEQLKINIENSLNMGNIEKEAKEKLGMDKLTNKQTVYVTLPKKDYVESANKKIVIEDKKSWFDKLAEWIFRK